MGDSGRIPLQAGDKYGHGSYFKLDVRKMEDGVYPCVRTGPATMTLPWRYDDGGEINVCLLVQQRADTVGGEIIKVSGGYNGTFSPDEAALAHTSRKLGLKPGKRQLVWWRVCLGVGPQYKFPIDYSFLQDPIMTGEETAAGCSRRWMTIKEACRLATAQKTTFFDDFSPTHLLILLTNDEEIAKLS